MGFGTGVDVGLGGTGVGVAVGKGGAIGTDGNLVGLGLAVGDFINSGLGVGFPGEGSTSPLATTWFSGTGVSEI